MSETLLVSAVGTVIGIDLSGLDEGDATAVREAWTDALTDGEAAATVAPTGGERASMLMRLSQQVTLAAITQRRGSLWMLHAAGIATDDGDAVVFVGPSGRGKTTAARTLGQSFGYLSDETVGIEADGRVVTYRKPLSIIEDPAQPKVERAPSSVGLRPVPEATPRVRAVVLLERDPAHEGAPVVEICDLGDVLGDLVAQTSYLPDMTEPLQFIARVARETGGIRAVAYREASDLPAVIPALLHARDASGIGGPALRPAVPATSTVPGEPRYRRTEAVDALALTDPDRVAILTIDPPQGGRVHVVAGVGPAVWRAAEGAPFAVLLQAALDEYGAPEGGGAERAVWAALGSLIDEGLVASDEPRFRRADDVAWVDRDDRVVAMALEKVPGAPRTLAGSAALLWDWLAEPVTATQLIARSIEVAGESADAVPGQIRGFLADLEAAHLIVVCDDTEDQPDGRDPETSQV